MIAIKKSYVIPDISPGLKNSIFETNNFNKLNEGRMNLLST